MSGDDSTLSSLERQRLHLENNLRELQRSLYTWRTWEAEYDGLKIALASRADINANDERRDLHHHDADVLQTALEYISSPPSSSTVSGIRAGLGAEPGSGLEVGVDSDTGPAKSVLTPAEIQDILYGNQNHANGKKENGGGDVRQRSRAQVLSLLDRRIDYVRENVKILERRVEEAQGKVEGWMAVVAVEDNEGDDGVLPVTEIVEELDEEGNLVKGNTVRAGDGAMELLDVLKRAGVKELEGEENGSYEKEEISGNSKDEQAGRITDAETATPVTTSNATSVSNVSTNGSTRDARRDDDERKDEGSTITDVDESPEDAALRREMLQYDLEEVGAVVAELELDDSGSEFSVDGDGYIMSDDEDDDDEDEDEYGRTTGRVIDEDYHRQMLELERKLNARGLHNIGPNTDALPAEVRQEMEGGSKEESRLERDGQKPSAKQNKKPIKRVAFADELDIAPDPDSSHTPAPRVQTEKKKVVEPPTVTPIQEQIIERTERDRPSGDMAAKPAKKTSRFKSARRAKESTPAPTPTPAAMHPNPPRAQHPAQPSSNLSLFPATPTEPKPFSQPIVYPAEQSSHQAPATTAPATPIKPLSDTLVERTPSSITPASEPDPDDFDEAMHQREVTTEFYRLRNQKIQQEGGFLQNEEEESIVPLDEGEGEKKVSRFKAARLKNNT